MILDDIVANTRQELAQAKRRLPLGELLGRAREAPPRRDYAGALRGDDIRLIAEIKKASPSKGVLREDFDPLAIAACYVAAGAHAISVLTDRTFFQGSLDDLYRVSQYSTLPLLRKDFVVDPYQVYEAVVAGASSALLIVGIVDDATLADLIALQRSLGLEPQVEVHDEVEVERALTAGALIVGINNRDLKTFAVDLATTERLRPLIPADRIVVSESGIHRAADVARLRRAGVQAMHIGESLMASPDPGLKVRELYGK
ncbi:MAG TPA: indole-3-glycerol phosphate synthase TrpC [Chloroflexota bacterium]|nr:indole-3-glycerol phosphate synthase TrpC [Chloroflexota bacterium]